MHTEFGDASRWVWPAVHDGRWGLANLEVCLALVESSRTRSEVPLAHQVPLRR
jgi:phthalate 4,5-cis-dihydrodiol dehydrogenase